MHSCMHDSQPVIELHSQVISCAHAAGGACIVRPCKAIAANLEKIPGTGLSKLHKRREWSCVCLNGIISSAEQKAVAWHGSIPVKYTQPCVVATAIITFARFVHTECQLICLSLISLSLILLYTCGLRAYVCCCQWQCLICLGMNRYEHGSANCFAVKC